VSIAHVGGLPLEETVSMCGPAVLASVGAVTAWLRARRAGHDPPAESDEFSAPPQS
jgi:hypothetical protein